MILLTKEFSYNTLLPTDIIGVSFLCRRSDARVGGGGTAVPRSRRFAMGRSTFATETKWHLPYCAIWLAIPNLSARPRKRTSPPIHPPPSTAALPRADGQPSQAKLECKRIPCVHAEGPRRDGPTRVAHMGVARVGAHRSMPCLSARATTKKQLCCWLLSVDKSGKLVHFQFHSARKLELGCRAYKWRPTPATSTHRTPAFSIRHESS